MDKFSEAVKNFFVSGALMIICGICFLFALGKTTWGIVCIGVGLVFIFIGLSTHAKEKDKSDGDK